MKEELIAKIKELGMSDIEAEELFNVIAGETLNILFKDLAEKSTDEELTVIESRIKEAKSTEHFETIINEIAVTVYGAEAQSEIKNIYLDLFDSFKQNIEDAKALIERANNGDVEAQKVLESAKQTETYHNIMGQE